MTVPDEFIYLNFPLVSILIEIQAVSARVYKKVKTGLSSIALTVNHRVCGSWL